MPSILTQHYRTTLASAFLNKLQVWEGMESALTTNAISISTGALTTIYGAGKGPEVLYLCIGYPHAWANTSNSAINDTNPPTPTEDVRTLSFDVWKNMIGAKRIYTANMSYVVPRVDWTANTVYDQYDDTATDLHTKTLFVLDTSDVPYRVYKCLWNNDGALSTSSPSIAIEDSLIPEETIDGYVWKYMYSLPTTRDKYLTTSWMPVYEDANVVTYASDNRGSLPTAVPLVIEYSGTGYGTSAPTINLYGDGIGATVSAAGAQLVGGSIQRITLSSGGNNYTEIHTVNTYQVGASSAIARAIIPPYRNHGYDPVNEMFAKHLMVTAVLDGNEGEHLTVNNDFRQISLIVNPIELSGTGIINGCPIASHDFYRQTYDITLSSNTGVFSPDDEVYTMSQTDVNGRIAIPTGIVVDVMTPHDTIINVLRLTHIHPEGLTSPFPDDSTIRCSDTSVEGTVESSSPPELVPYFGEVIYLNQRAPVSRTSGQLEEIKIVLPFGG